MHCKIILKSRLINPTEEGHQFVSVLPDTPAQFVIIQWITCVVPKLANLLMHSQCALSEPISSSRKTRKLTVCRLWRVTLAKSIVPRKTWWKLWHAYISKLFLTKMQVKFSIFFYHGNLNVRLRELSSTETGSYPHEFLCRTNCSACANYQPWIDQFKCRTF
jgi:hypothetical protein